MTAWQRLKQSHPRLAEQFKQAWDMPLAQYATCLFQAPTKKLDPDFLRLLRQHAQEDRYPAPWGEALCTQLEQTPVIQTSHHITPTHGPGLTSIDLISLSGLAPQQIYPIFAASGVPFSNAAWSGALSYGDIPLEQLFQPGSTQIKQATAAQQERNAHGSPLKRISLIPSKWRDHLVYCAHQTDALEEKLTPFSTPLRQLLADPQIGSPWSNWAGRTAAKLQGLLFNRKVMIFDLNRIMADFLALKIAQEDPLILSLFDSKDLSPSIDFFVPYTGKKSLKLARSNWQQGQLHCDKIDLNITNLTALAQALLERKVCPGTWTSLFLMRFVLGLKCLGSFNQFEYLESFRTQLTTSSLAHLIDLKPSKGDLTTGRLEIEGNGVWPLDWVLQGKQLELSQFQGSPMSKLWAPILEQLTSPKQPA